MHALVLCLQDTTELDYHGRMIKGLGPLSYEAQRGLYLHPTYVVTTERDAPGGEQRLDLGARAEEGRGPAQRAARERAQCRALRAHRQAGARDAGHATRVLGRPRERHPSLIAAEVNAPRTSSRWSDGCCATANGPTWGPPPSSSIPRTLGGRAGTRHAITGQRDLCVMGCCKPGALSIFRHYRIRPWR